MLRHYLTLATKVLLRRKFFTFISLFAISFTLLVLTVATALMDHAFGPAAPESRQDRMLGVYKAYLYGDESAWGGGGGFTLFDRHARDLPGVERLSIFTNPAFVSSYVGGGKIRSSLKRTDGEFWQILDFTFIEGAPYSTEDAAQAQFVAVINRATRRTFFNGQPAVGRTIEADGQRFRVVGVVEDVSELRWVPFADIWVPYTTAKSDAYRTGIMGNFEAIVLARDRAALAQIREEFNSRLEHIELPDPKQYKAIVAPFETKYESVARTMSFWHPDDPRSNAGVLTLMIAGLTVLFILLPTVNLININVSRIMERASEIGVRKAFGASSRTLVGQFIVENVLLTLVGAGVGFVLSVFVLRAFNESGLIRYAHLTLNGRVFAYGFALAVAFGLISGVYPAWRMSRLQPVDALNGGRSR